MAIPFLNNINLDNNELQNAKLHNTGSANTNPGQIYFDTGDNLAKYYSNGVDLWVDLKEYSFGNGTFVNLSTTGTTAKPIITADLSATGTPDATKYLRGDNAWEPITSIPGTYTFDVTADTGTDQTVNSGDTLSIAGGTNISTVVGLVDTVTVNLDDNIDLAGTLTVSGTGQSSFAGQVTIPTTPSASTDAASKAYVDSSVAGGLVYQGGYNAATNTPDLDSSPSSSIEKGWTYTVTADGSFFTEQVRVGDVLISEVNSPTALSDWTTVQNNIDLASASQIGIGNVASSTEDELLGINVTYNAGGTAFVGLDIDGLGAISTISDPGDNYVPFYDDANGINRKIAIDYLATELNGLTSKAFTITDTATVTHSLGRDVIIQLYDNVTFETVYADVDRISVSQATITFATTPTNSIRVLVQKIG
jgi:hypothetical protein